MKRLSTYVFILAALLLAPGLFYLCQGAIFGTNVGEIKNTASFVLASMGFIALVVAAIMRYTEE